MKNQANLEVRDTNMIWLKHTVSFSLCSFPPKARGDSISSVKTGLSNYEGCSLFV